MVLASPEKIITAIMTSKYPRNTQPTITTKQASTNIPLSTSTYHQVVLPNDPLAAPTLPAPGERTSVRSVLIVILPPAGLLPATRRAPLEVELCPVETGVAPALRVARAGVEWAEEGGRGLAAAGARCRRVPLGADWGRGGSGRSWVPGWRGGRLDEGTGEVKRSRATAVVDTS